MKALFYCFAIFLFGWPVFAADSKGIAIDPKFIDSKSKSATVGKKVDSYSKNSEKDSKVKKTDTKDKAKEPESGCEVFEIDLETVFGLIEDENLTVLLNREKIEQALQDMYVKRADLYPQVNASLTQTRDRLVFPIGGNREGAFYANRFDGIFTGSYPLFNLNKIAGYRSAKMGWQISALNYNSILQDVLTATGKLYYLHIRNLKALDVTDANIKEAEVLLELAEARFKAGVASPIDVTKAEVQVAIYKRDRLSQEIIIKMSELDLKEALNLCVDLPIKVKYVDSDKERPKPNLEKPPICEVYQNRFDYLTAYWQLERNIYDYRAAGWASYPVINLFGEWGYASGLAFQSSTAKEEWTIGVEFTMPVLDGYRILANTMSKCSLIRQQQYILQQVIATINTEFTLNAYTLELRHSEIELTRKQVALGQEELELAKTRFKEGVADNTDIVLAQTNLATFMDNLVNILYLYDVSRLDWARTLGDVRKALCDAD